LATLSDDGNIIQESNCLRNLPTGGYDPFNGDSCFTYSHQAKQLDAATLQTVKETILQATPFSLRDSYPCGANHSCTTDTYVSTVRVTVDGQTKSIEWSDDGPAVSPDLTMLLNLLQGIGF
jgi:hypothetical protein